MIKNAFLAAEAATTRKELDEIMWRLSVLRGNLALLLKYRPDQARVPAGEPDGGQWVEEHREEEGSSPAGAPDAGVSSPSRRVQVLKVDDALRHLETHAKPRAGINGFQCAKYAREALHSGGVSLTPPRQRSTSNEVEARDYGPSLEAAGFRIVLQDTHPATPPVSALLEAGDVVVIQDTSRNGFGHMAMYTGSGWISDYRQRDFWPGTAYRLERPRYAIYRVTMKD